MAICVNGHSYDGLHPDNKDGCYVCKRADLAHKSNQEICDLPASVKCGDVECESIRLSRVEAMSSQNTGSGPVGPTPQIEDKPSGHVRQCEETTDGIIGGIVRCQRFYGHEGEHRSLGLCWDLNRTWQNSSETMVPKLKQFEINMHTPVTIREWQNACYENAKAHGFHDNNPTDDGFGIVSRLLIAEKLALIHSEVSEALEDLRDGKMEEEIFHNTGKSIGFPSELADIVIRVLDLSGMLGIDLEGAMRRKHEYNKSRPYSTVRSFNVV